MTLTVNKLIWRERWKNIKRRSSILRWIDKLLYIRGPFNHVHDRLKYFIRDRAAFSNGNIFHPDVMINDLIVSRYLTHPSITQVGTIKFERKSQKFWRWLYITLYV